VQGVLERAGGALDRLVLCAGLGGHLPDILPVARVNYFGAVDVLDGLRKALEDAPQPAAVAICSNSAQFGPFEEHPFVQALLDHDEERAISLLGPDDGFLAYGGSKHALCRALRRRAAEWGAAGVRLNGVAPGATETPLLQGSIDHPTMGEGVKQLPIPLGRFATPPEIAAMVAFLLGPEASFVHGSIVYVDGGSDAVIRPDRF
jgi:NAD(P)-dependent dehydrogenase (short-subunit alcohol dehydrogenase family)